MAQHRHQIRIGGRIENQKAGVHTAVLALQRHIDGVGVTTGVIIGLEQRDLVLFRQQPGRRQPRNARADDGNSHAFYLC